MKSFRKNIGTILFLCICSNTYAQYDNYDSVEDWTLEDVEEEAPKPQHPVPSKLWKICPISLK